jgi:hypothetical protein
MCLSIRLGGDQPPANGAPVGRFGRVIWPPIGTYMRRSRETGDVITPRVRSLAMDGLAHGYVAMVEAEALGKTHEGPEVHVVRGRNAEDVWPYWVTDMSRGRLLGAVADPDAVRQVANAAGRNLVQGLQELGLGRSRRGRRFFTGYLYGEAGMLLRHLQTDRFQPDLMTEVVVASKAWPFEEMPIEPAS